jgi:Tol biopolymer transport system component
MPASTEKGHSVFARCLQGSNAHPAALMLLAALFAAGTVSAQQRRIQLDDLAKIVTVSDPRISPDGKSIVCVVTRPNLDKDRYDDQLVLVEIATGAQKALTFDRKGVRSPRWSPSGDRLAFLAVVPYTEDNKDDGANKQDSQQVFVMPMSGGDARKVTNAPNGVGQFAWRPNGKDIAYVTSDDPPNHQDPDADPERHGRRTRPHHAVVPALPCPERQWSAGEIRSLPDSRT